MKMASGIAQLATLQLYLPRLKVEVVKRTFVWMTVCSLGTDIEFTFTEHNHQQSVVQGGIVSTAWCL